MSQPANEAKIDDSLVTGELWLVAIKLRGLGEIMRRVATEIHLSEDAIIGLGRFLTDFADSLDELREKIEEDGMQSSAD